MRDDLGPIKARRKTGDEQFTNNDEKGLGFTVLDFWQWSASDLVSNATRGLVAEFLVAKALGIDTTGVREEWAAFDLTYNGNVKIEVKSAAYLQSWDQKDYSKIIFNVRKTIGIFTYYQRWH